MVNGLPNVILAGVTKGGTTSLRQYLIDHPDISGASVKETFFWNRLDAINRPNLLEYAKLFTDQSTPWILDNTPRYFHDLGPNCQKLKEHLGDNLRIIIILREPKSRAFSFYKFKKRRLEIDESTNFSEYVKQCIEATEEEKRQSKEVLAGLDEGKYAERLQEWQNAFKDRLKVVFFDQLKTEPTACVGEIARWLNIDAHFYDQYDFKKENASFGFKNRGLHKIGMGVYKALEPILLKNKAFRRTITNLYYQLNGKKVEEKITQETNVVLDKFYEDSITSLSQIECIFTNAFKPDWIKSKP